MHLYSVANAVAHVKRNGTDIFHTQVTRAANTGATIKGWHFSFEDEIPHSPLVANAPPEQCTSGGVLFLPPTCACFGDKLLGDILTCMNCNHKVHALCTQRGHYFKCVCRVVFTGVPGYVKFALLHQGPQAGCKRPPIGVSAGWRAEE